ncbi:hypothetical protein WAF17_00960 [Bernardetia sp. ABR2-2B]|uniref:hypothetical protein n=1 Tax=Bernardetia sp. ABR2-2B TaxID=3127472 RepID=UPI0030CBD3AA
MSKKIFDLIFIKAKTDFFNKFLDKTPVFYFSDDILFKKNIKEKIQNIEFITIKVILDSILKYIENSEKQLVNSNEKPIKLYVLFGVDYMIDDEKTFQITIAHQKMNPITKQLNEHRVELHYLPSKFSGVEEDDIRWEDEEKINVFLERLRKSKGFIKSLSYKPMRVLVESEEI